MRTGSLSAMPKPPVVILEDRRDDTSASEDGRRGGRLPDHEADIPAAGGD
ncbi:hypothetical protein [Candidatus Poriferisocius sp.]